MEKLMTAQEILAELKRMGWTGSQVSLEVGITQGNVSRISQGRQQPRASVYLKMLDLLYRARRQAEEILTEGAA